MGGDGLRFPCLADHEQLRKDSHGLQVDGEGPQNLRERPEASVGTQHPPRAHRKYSRFTVEQHEERGVWATEYETE